MIDRRYACVGGSDISVEDNWFASANWIGDPYKSDVSAVQGHPR